MTNQLDHAYDLIKNEQQSEAMAILEPYIRENRDDADAWWLYANATDDPEAKRNALNNILRIGISDNPVREEKVHFMLAQLDDPYALPQKRSLNEKKGGLSTAMKVMLGIGTVFGICACVSIFAIVSLANKMLYVPIDYDNQGSIEAGQVVSGTVDKEGDWDGFLYQGKAGENITLSISNVNGDVPPFIFMYTPDGTFFDISDENEYMSNRLRETLPTDGTYTIIVRPFFGFGAGDYDLTVTSK